MSRPHWRAGVPVLWALVSDRFGSTAANGPIQSVAFQNVDSSIALVVLNEARHATVVAAHWQGMGPRCTRPLRGALTWPWNAPG